MDEKILIHEKFSKMLRGEKVKMGRKEYTIGQMSDGSFSLYSHGENYRISSDMQVSTLLYHLSRAENS